MKRLIDFISVIIGLVIISPILILLVFLIKLDSPGPVLFKQQRVGQNERMFYIYKFRTMVMNAENEGLKITVGNDSRITRIGVWLRKLKLDELPQLFNVLKGDMSLVGPRPEVPEYLKYYPRVLRKKIFQVKPGITDPASLIMIDESNILNKATNPEELYINEILPQKLSLAAKYVDESNIFLDLVIVIKTIFRIIVR